MAKKHRGRDEEAWKNAKKVCRLSVRQVEMARALGMNPKKLPRLRPSPQQRWKLPVGAFIEECYRKRFDRHVEGDRPHEPAPDAPTRWREAQAPGRIGNQTLQVSNLTCYLVNLADDLQRWLMERTIDADVLAQVSEELREIAEALETGAPISEVPGIPLPPERPARRRAGRKLTLEDDDEIPF